MSSIADVAVAHTPCTRCDAQPGRRCTTNTGARATGPHNARWRAAHAAWLEGYWDASNDWTTQILHAAETGDWAVLTRRAQAKADWIRKERS